MNKKKRVLICPLDWGLGHATRCIPIINELLANDADVIIGADKKPLKLLQLEFPQLEFVIFPGVSVTYPKTGRLAAKIFLTLPGFIYHLVKEHLLLQKLIKKHNINVVISDNRYGLWSRSIPCIFITHQINIHGKVVMYILKKLNHFFINKFDHCWIPDFEGKDNLSGALSHGKYIPRNCYFIGPVSRFKKSITIFQKKYDILVIISGPEHQRTVFENLIIKQLNLSTKKALVVRGLPDEKLSLQNTANVQFVNHLKSEELQQAILESDIVISRPGYTTIMDLYKLGKAAILVPTPGQTEQEYLAEYLQEKKMFYAVQDQKEFDLEKSLVEIEKYKIPSFNNNETLISRVKGLLS